MGNITKDTKEGQEFIGKPKYLTEDRVWNFSGGYPKGPDWPAKNIHTDLEFARNCGLKTRAVSAAMFVGYLAELMITLFTESWLSYGKLDLKFIAPVDVGEKVVSKAVVKSKTVKNSDTVFMLDVWVENENGNKAVIGAAMGRI